MHSLQEVSLRSRKKLLLDVLVGTVELVLRPVEQRHEDAG